MLPLVCQHGFAYVDPSAFDAEVLRVNTHLACIQLFKQSQEGKRKEGELNAIKKRVNDELWYSPSIRELRRKLGFSHFKSDEEMYRIYKETLVIEIPQCR